MSNWKWYATDDSCKVIKGWYQDKDSKWYYLDEKNGDMKTGWIQLKSIWYYLEPSSNGYMGECYVNRSANIDGKSYSFDENGHMLENSLISDQCIDFVKSYEGFFDHAYDDGTGVMIIGYGIIREDRVALNYCTEEQATELLKEEINIMAKTIKDDLDSNGVSLSQNEFDALCSMSYNIGQNGLLGSTLYRRICEGVRDESLKDNFTVWSKAGGKTMQGLFNRRVEEYEMFANADYTRNL